MSGRPIVLPELPKGILTWGELSDIEAYARAAVEADRRGIVVTDEDVLEAITAFASEDGVPYAPMLAALESFAARLRGET